MSNLTPERHLQSVITLWSESLVACPGCGTPVAPRRPNQQYCGPKCRAVAFVKRQGQARRERDAKARLLLRTVIETAREVQHLLEEPHDA